ncbi:MAG: carboxylating nicotinate-nucleotide diphosphorylase [Bacteroidetes bacterium]|nr:carboxylating nicotinate-nucleotide diphosphorylase [Bacteroidota bacterium]
MDNPDRIERIIEDALREDAGMGDITTDSIFAENIRGVAELTCKGSGVVAGLEVAAMVFHACDPGAIFGPTVEDGASVKPGDVLAAITGSVRGLLLAERTALNLLQRMSGIATSTRRYVDAIAGTTARITDTRKTMPGLRVLDKWAVRLGGGMNHRFGLDDMVLIKDNHIAAAGSITKAVAQCRTSLSEKKLNLAIEVETSSMAQVEEALRCRGVARIMLDNFPVPAMREAVTLIDHRVEVEASGGITLDTVRAVAETGVDLISVGALTHSVHALDISLELTPHA